MKSLILGLILVGFAVSAQQAQTTTTPPAAPAPAVPGQPAPLTGVPLACKNLAGYFEVVHYGTTLWSKRHYDVHMEFPQGQQGLKLFTNYGSNGNIEIDFENLKIVADGAGYPCQHYPQECLEETSAYISTLTLSRDRTVSARTTDAAREAVTCAILRITNFHKEVREKILGQGSPQ